MQIERNKKQTNKNKTKRNCNVSAMFPDCKRKEREFGLKTTPLQKERKKIFECEKESLRVGKNVRN